MSWFLHTCHCTSSRSYADGDCPPAAMLYNARSSFLSSGHIPTSTPEPGEAPCHGGNSLANSQNRKFKFSLLVPAHKERAGFFLLLIPLGTRGYNSGSKRALRVGESREVTKNQYSTFHQKNKEALQDQQGKKSTERTDWPITHERWPSLKQNHQRVYHKFRLRFISSLFPTKLCWILTKNKTKIWGNYIHRRFWHPSFGVVVLQYKTQPVASYLPLSIRLGKH